MGNDQHQWASRPTRGSRGQGEHGIEQPDTAREYTALSGSTPQMQRLTLSMFLVNQLLNVPSHRPDAVRLLRQILHDRTIRHAASLRDENHQFG